MNPNIFYATIAALGLATLYLLYLHKKTTRETLQQFQILDAKCNRLNTMLQTSQSRTDLVQTMSNESSCEFEPKQEEMEEDTTVHPEDVTPHSIPDTYSEEGDANVEKLKEEYNNFEDESSTEKIVFDYPDFSQTLDKEVSPENNNEENAEKLSEDLIKEINALEENEEETLEDMEKKLDSLESLESLEEELLQETLETQESTNEVQESQSQSQDYESMTVKELKEIARNKGLIVGGKKDELVERIKNSNTQSNTLTLE